MKDLQNHSKKKKKKEPITKRESKSVTDVNKGTGNKSTGNTGTGLFKMSYTVYDIRGICTV